MRPDRVSKPGPLTYKSGALLARKELPQKKERSNCDTVYYLQLLTEAPVTPRVYPIYPAIRQGFCPSRMTSNN